MNEVCNLLQDYLMAAGSGWRLVGGGREKNRIVYELIIVETR